MHKSLMVKDAVPTLMEWGKIKIGKKGKMVRNTFRLPTKLDHFIITTMDKDDSDNYIPDSELMQKLGGENLKEIPIRLCYNEIDLNFQTRYVCYHGTKCWCTGDGESATRDGEERECPCERIDPTYTGEDGKGKGKCKKTGCLSCLIQGAEIVGGTWKFRTTSRNSTDALLASLLLIKHHTGGILADIPLSLVIRPKRTTIPTTGESTTIQVVTVVYKGSPASLREQALKIMESEATNKIKIENMESDVRKMLTTTVDEEIVGDEVEFSEEFAPEDAAGETETAPPKEEKPKKKRGRKKKSESAPKPEPDPEVEPPESETETGTIEPPDGEDYVFFE